MLMQVLLPVAEKCILELMGTCTIGLVFRIEILKDRRSGFEGKRYVAVSELFYCLVFRMQKVTRCG